MDSFWYSLDVVDNIRLFAQWTVAIVGIIALVFTMRSNTLKNTHEVENSQRDATEKENLKARIDSAHQEARDAKQQASVKEAELAKLREQAAEADRRIAKAEDAITIAPLPKRLRGLMDSIDPRILELLRSGRTDFNAGITFTQFNDLQRIAKEPGAERYIRVSPQVKTGIGMGPEGITYGVEFTLDPRLMKE